MYSNMSTFRNYPNTYSSMPNSMTSSTMAYDAGRRNMSSSSMPYNSMPSSMPSSMSSSNQDSRIIGGGFLAPFVLGGITGGLLAPAFYRPYPYNPYPYYGPYWR